MYWIKRLTIALFGAVLLTRFASASDPTIISLRIPSSFTFVSKSYSLSPDGMRELTTHSLGVVEFLDGDNFHTKLVSLLSIQLKFQEDGKNLRAIEEEKVIYNGELLTLSRHSEAFRAKPPENSNEIREMVAKHLPTDGDVILQQKINLETKNECLGSFGVFVDFSLPIFESSLAKIDVRKVELIEQNDSKIKFRQKKGKSIYNFEFIRLGDSWTLAECSISLVDLSQKNGVQKRESKLTLDDHSDKSLHYARKVKVEHSNGQKYEAWETCDLTNIMFGTRPLIALTTTIKNKTPVILFENQQIKAAWMNGKIVRVFDSGTIDDLGTATFQTSKSVDRLSFVMWALAVVGFGTFFVWWSRLKRRVPQIKRSSN